MNRLFKPLYRALFGAAALFAVALPATAQGLTFDSKAAFEKAVRAYLLDNPRVVIEAIEEFQRQQSVAEKMPKVEIYRGFLEDGTVHASLGNPKGDVTIVEFFDYRCGYCKRHFPSVMKVLNDNPNVRLIPLHYPILDRPGQPKVSRMAARAAIASEEQGKFAEFHAAMMTFQGSLSEDHIYTIAADVGLDVARLKQDMNSKLVDKRITNNLAIGAEIGWRGTPAYVIGNDIVEGAAGIDRLEDAVDRAKKASQKSR